MLSVEQLETRATPAAFTVMNLDDAGPGSLRDRIALVNASQDATNTIDFAAGLSGNISLESGLPQIQKHVTITGNPNHTVTIRRSLAAGMPDFRIFEIGQAGLTGVQFDLGGVFVKHGRADKGAGIWVRPGNTCNLYNVFVVENRTTDTDGRGAGIFNEGVLTIENSNVAYNMAAGDGGGLYNVGSKARLDIRYDTSIDHNSTGAGGAGGGIFIASGTVTIDDSTIKENTADFAGGGILNEAGRLILSNSELSLNTAATGGGLYVGNVLGGGDAQLTSVTLSGNRAILTGQPDAGKGGGFRVMAGGTLNLSSCTVSGNLSGTPGAPIFPAMAGGWVELGGIYTTLNCTISDQVQNDNP